MKKYFIILFSLCLIILNPVDVLCETTEAMSKDSCRVENNNSISDSAEIADCFVRLLYSGYNPDDYQKFINNSYYGKYPVIEKKRYFSFKPGNEVKNKLLSKKVENIHMLDQSFRKKWGTVPIEETEKESWRKIKEIDSANQQELIKIVWQYGKLPSEKEIGSAGMLQIIIILRHLGSADPATIEYLYPIMVKQAIAGDFPPIEIAGIIDYNCMGNKPVFIDSVHYFDTQIYVTATIPLEGERRIFMPNTTTTEKRIIVPIADWKQMKRLRRKIGLRPLKEEMKQNPNLIYDEELYKSKFMRTLNK